MSLTGPGAKLKGFDTSNNDGRQKAPGERQTALPGIQNQ